jgi:hypothetical protein
LLSVPQYVPAQESASKSNGGEAKETSKRIRENFDTTVAPLSNSLAYLLTRTLLNDIKAEPQETLNRLDVGMARTIWII